MNFKSIFLGILATVVFASCNRSSDTGEIQRLKEELEKSKTQRATTPKPPPHPDYVSFIRTARRFLSALDTGTSVDEYRTRATELVASAAEAARHCDSEAKSRAVMEFATAVTDALDLWKYQNTTHPKYFKCPKLNVPVKPDMEPGKFSELTAARFGEELKALADERETHSKWISERWNNKTEALVKLYKLNESPGDTCPPYWITSIEIAPALQYVFQFCRNTFQTLDQ